MRASYRQRWMTRRTWQLLGLGGAMAFVLSCADGSSEGGSGDEGPFEIASIEDQTVIRNTIEPRSVEVVAQLTGEQAPTEFSVAIDSDNALVVADEVFDCTSNPCPITFAASAEANAEVTVNVRAAVGNAEAETSFVVHVVPLLVRERADGNPAPPDSLRDVIDRAVDGDVIGFDTDGQFAQPRVTTLVEQLTVDKDLTIEGPGREMLTLDGDGETRIIQVLSSSTLAISDITLSEGMADQGGAISIGELSTLRAERCALAENQAMKGGGIACDGCNLSVTDCTFLGNAASEGGAIAVDEGTLTLDTVTFGGPSRSDGNVALTIGGAVLTDASSATVVNSAFMGNRSEETASTATAGGGAIATRGNNDLTIDRTRFEANQAGRLGGAILVRASSCAMTDVVFTSNEAASGGAIYHTGPSLTVRGAEFDANVGRGGTAAIDSSVEAFGLSDATFINHRGSRVLDLGALGTATLSATVQRVSVTDSDLSRAAIGISSATAVFEDIEVARTVSRDLGGAFEITAIVELRRAILIDNEVTAQAFASIGGAVYVFAGQVTFVDSELRGNRASEGGAIYVFDGTAILYNTILEGNTATEKGGGLYVYGEAQLLDGSEVRGNAASAGGGLFVDTYGVFSMTGGAIGGGGLNDGNEADLGGGIFNFGAVTLDSVLLNANQAVYGGGISQVAPGEGAAPLSTLLSTAFVINGADQQGGGIYVNSGMITSDGNLNFTGNMAGAAGGAIYVDGANITGVSGNFALNVPDDIAMP
jgi:predicted outer membrane repeat protein